MTRPIGTDVPRPDGPAKVEGSAVYIADLAVPGAWIGGVVRSEVPSGRLLGFDLDPAFDFEQVVLVRPEDIPGDNVIAVIEDDQPVLAADLVRHVGEPLMLVAAPDAETLAAALAAVRPRIEPMPAQLDLETAEHVFKQITIEKGDAQGVLAGAARVLEETYRTDSQEQMYIEPQGFVAWPPTGDGTIRVQGSLQCPYYVQKALCRAFGVEPAQARVQQAVTGGGFGGKEDYPSVIGVHAALLARAAGRPVRLIFDRHEDLLVTPKRHPARITHRTAVGDDGSLLAADIEVVLDGGAYVTLSPVVLSRACIHAAGPYRCENVRIRGRVVRTNHVPYGAFRGFGAPQVCFAVERQMDLIARTLGINPAVLRERNMLRTGDRTATGQHLLEGVGSEEVMERVLAKSAFHEHDWGTPRTPAGRRVRGRGISFFFHGAGFTGSGEQMLKGRVGVELIDGGRVLVRSASTEIGQGTLTLFQTIAAEALGCAVDDVELAPIDTKGVPDSGPTVASRTCMIVGSCLERACRDLRARVESATPDSGADFRARAREFTAGGGDGSVEVTYASPPGLEWDDATYRGDAYPTYGWAADVADVEVDLDTFEVHVVRFLSTVDVGKAIQPQLVEGQLQGGALQAIGFAHLEVVTSRDGRVQQDRMATCIIPTTLDTPPIEIELVEVPFPHGPSGAKGIGEIPLDGGAPAVASAIEDATGLRMLHLPITPERLMDAWLEAHPEERL